MTKVRVIYEKKKALAIYKFNIDEGNVNVKIKALHGKNKFEERKRKKKNLSKHLQVFKRV